MKRASILLLVGLGSAVLLCGSSYAARMDFVPVPNGLHKKMKTGPGQLPPGLQKKTRSRFRPPGLEIEVPEPFLMLTVGGEAYEANPIMYLPNGKLFSPKKKIRGGKKNRPDFEIEYQMFADVDPFISYTFSAMNFTDEPLPFSATGSIFLEPVLDGPNTVYSSLGGSVMDLGGGGQGVSIRPAATAADTDHDGLLELQTAFVGDGNGWMNLGIDVGSDFFSEGAIASYGPYETAKLSGPVGEWTELGYSLEFVLSPNSSVAFNGYVKIDPVSDNVMANPIPPTVYLFATGLVGLVGLRRRIR